MTADRRALEDTVKWAISKAGYAPAMKAHGVAYVNGLVRSMR